MGENGSYVKISDSLNSTFHCSPGCEIVKQQLMEMNKLAIIKILRTSKIGSKIILDEIEVLDGNPPREIVLTGGYTETIFLDHIWLSNNVQNRVGIYFKIGNSIHWCILY